MFVSVVLDSTCTRSRVLSRGAGSVSDSKYRGMFNLQSYCLVNPHGDVKLDELMPLAFPFFYWNRMYIDELADSDGFAQRHTTPGM